MMDFVEYVYYSAIGQLSQEEAVPGVENLFADGSICDGLYAQVLEAYERLRERLGVLNEDDDVEIIIDNLLEIGDRIGYEMYRCGALFGRGEDFVRRENIHSDLPPCSLQYNAEGIRQILQTWTEKTPKR